MKCFYPHTRQVLKPLPLPKIGGLRDDLTPDVGPLPNNNGFYGNQSILGWST